MKFTVGANALTVNSLGRLCLAGNAGTHTIKLVNASNGTDIAGGSLSINMAGCTAGQFRYATLPNPVALTANRAYYLASQESVGGDLWYEFGAVSSTNVAAVNASVWFDGVNWNALTSTANTSYVPVDFLYGTSFTPDLTITKTHTGNFTQGQTGATYTITATNSGGASTSGTVSVSDTVPMYLTATGIAGTGWSCTQPAGPCTRSDALATGLSYAPLTLTVNVAANAPSRVTNTATISGGGETNTSNNSASDQTNVQSFGGSTAFLTSHTSGYLRNDFGSFVGMKLTVGASQITVNSLGRICISGNSGTHSVKLVDTITGDVPNGSISLNMAGCTVGQFKYATLTTPVTLTANRAYYLASQESVGGDLWYEFGAVSSTNVAAVNASVWFDGANWNALTSTANTSYVPVDFLYQ